MTGEWIPWVKGLTRRTEVLKIASALKLSRREAACCCMEIWEWCDSEGSFDESRNCHVFVTDLSLLDEMVGIVGFGTAMLDAGWIIVSEESEFVFPGLGQYVGTSAKERLSARRRKQKERICHGFVTKKSRSKRDKSVTSSLSCSSLSGIGIPIPVELDTEAFRCAWDNWEQVRQEKKKPLTPTAAKLRLADCLKIGHDAAVAGLTNSAMHGWIDVIVPEDFAPKPKPERTSRVATDEDVRNWVP